MTISPAVVLMTATSFIGVKNGDAEGGSRNNSGGLDVVKVGEVLLEVGIAFLLNAVLIRTSPARGAFAILTIDLVHDVHSLGHLAERREAVPVETAVVTKTDE